MIFHAKILRLQDYRFSSIWLRYWHGNRLSIHRSRVRLLAGHHRIVALGKLLAFVCFYVFTGVSLFVLRLVVLCSVYFLFVTVWL